MNSPFLHFILLLAAGWIPLQAQETRTNSAGTDYPAFRIVAERNIFNQSRSGRVSSRSQARSAKTESFTLVGAMTYEKGIFAFFDGSSAEFRKVAKPGDTIAGFKVVDVTLSGVSLLSTNNATIAFPIRSQMQRQDGGEWKLHAAPKVAAKFDASGGQTGETQSSASGENDVLKRLMQKREEELKNESK